MPPKYCIDMFGRCPKKFRNRRYENSLITYIDEYNRHLKQDFESMGMPAHILKKYRRKRQYGARINQNFHDPGKH